jgi:hypothetical protein
MDPGDWAAWTAAVVAVLALIVSAVSAAFSWKSLRWERLSADAAVRSAEAAERANRFAERAVEQQVDSAMARWSLQASGIASEEAFGVPTVTQAPPDVSWRIEHPSGNRYILRNIGTDVAEHVEVDASQAGPVTRNLPRDAVLRPGEGADMLIVGTFGHPIPNQLYVRWDGQPEWVAVPIIG